MNKNFSIAAFLAGLFAVLWVATGTAANCLALATLCPPHGGVVCHREAHIEVDEAGELRGDHRRARIRAISRRCSGLPTKRA